jgi:A/G-specific adenine glycosylase
MDNFFSKNILLWHSEQNTRKMPWKEESDPYKIWLSEIILQQTKVEQGLKYYENFVQCFPTIIDLAKTKDTIVFKMWEGLGYYNRCKNLLATARMIAKNNGIFPNTYNSLLQLKGIGPYTAAAIASFAYNLPHAVVDGNVYRVLSRFFGNSIPIDSTEGKKQYAELAQKLLDKNKSGLYNQAIMDLGATVCKPKKAVCNDCPLQKKCIAFATNTVYTLPIKEKKTAVRNRTILFYIIMHENKVLVKKRTEKDVWENLYAFPNVEIIHSKSIAKAFIRKNLPSLLKKNEYSFAFISDLYTQKLSHQYITAHFVKLLVNTPIDAKPYKWVSQVQMKKLPFAAIINDFLQNDEKHIIFDK